MTKTSEADVVTQCDDSERVPAKGCDGHYEINRLGEIFNGKTGRKLKLCLGSHGYLFFNDCYDGVRKGRLVHQIVLLSFDVPNPENKRTVNHKNGIKTDNRLENLEWYTDQEQFDHAKHVLDRKIGFQKGQPPHNKGKPRIEGAGKPPRPVRGIHLKTGEQREFESLGEAARQVGGHYQAIWSVCQGERKSAYGYRWEYVSESPSQENFNHCFLKQL